MTELDLYVNGLGTERTAWSEVGDSPYLNVQDEPTSYVYVENSKKAEHGDFTFTDSELSGFTINSVTLYVYAKYVNTRMLDCFIWNGTDWTEYNVTPDATYGWKSVAVPVLDTWTKIDGAKLYLKAANSNDRVDVDAAYLKVDYVGPTTQTVTRTSDAQIKVTSETTRTSDAQVYGATEQTKTSDAIISNFFLKSNEIKSDDYGACQALDTAAKKSSLRFTARESKTVDEIRVFVETATSPPVYTIGIQDDNGAGLPDGVFNDSNTFTPSTNWNTISLSGASTVTAGSTYHIVMEYSSGTIGISDFATLRGINPEQFRLPRSLDDNDQNYLDTKPIILHNSAGWKRDTLRKFPVFSIGYTDASDFGQVNGAGGAYNVWGVNRGGEKLNSCSSNILVDRIMFRVKKVGTPGDDLDFEIRTVSGNSQIATGTLITEASCPTDFQFIIASLPSPVYLSSGTGYRVGIFSPSAPNASNCYQLMRNVSISGKTAETYGGTNTTFTYSSDGGSSWNDTATGQDVLFGIDGLGWANYTSDANISAAATQTKTRTSDATIKGTSSQTYNSDSRIKIESETTRDSDARIKTTTEQTRDSDARIQSEQEQTYTSDADIKTESETSHTSDARIEVVGEQTYDSDARIKTTSEQTYDSDANIYLLTEQTYDSDTNITGTSEKTYTSDAKVGGLTEQFYNSDANIKGTSEKLRLSDARIWITSEAIRTSDAFIYLLTEQTYDSDARITAETEQTYTSDALIEALTTQTIQSDSRIWTTSSQTRLSDGRVWVTSEQLYNSDAFIELLTIQTYTSDARIETEVEYTYTSDAQVKITSETTRLSDANIYLLTEKTYLSDAKIYGTVSQTILSDAKIAAAEQLYTSDAQITGTTGQSYTSDAWIGTVYGGVMYCHQDTAPISKTINFEILTVFSIAIK